jgi:hypothetical protein
MDHVELKKAIEDLEFNIGEDELCKILDQLTRCEELFKETSRIVSMAQLRFVAASCRLEKERGNYINIGGADV